jgi:hypothetical protein
MPDLVLLDFFLKNNNYILETSSIIKDHKIPILYITYPVKSTESEVDHAVISESFINPYDISDLKYALENSIYKNKESENYYNAIFEHTGTATVIIEEDTTISLANTNFKS